MVEVENTGAKNYKHQLHPKGRRSYRESNSFSTMRKSQKRNYSSCSNTSLNSNNESIGDHSIDQDEFDSNVITSASTPFIDKTGSFSRQEDSQISDKSRVTNSKIEEEEESSTDTSTSSYFYYKLCLVIIMIGIGVQAVITNINKASIDIKELKEKFPNQPNETWIYFETVIDDILIIHPTHPAVFLLLYTKDEAYVNDLIQHLGKYASTKLETNENFIYVNKEEFHSEEAMKDYGYLIDKYEKDLIKKKVMVVEDLQEIPGNVAQAFHTLCDEITPLVDKVVYIFTLKVDSLNGKSEKIAETYLKQIWNDLDEDILMPLITRVTSTVLKIVN